MNLEVVKINGENAGRKINLSKAIFGIEPNNHAIYLDVKQYLANQRQGTHKSKERADISGSTRKIKKQKGTGTARAGSIKSPLFRGGGRAFGPRPRDYSFKLNKKLKVIARKSALSYKAKEKSIKIIENFSFDIPKTKNYLTLLGDLKVIEKKTLFVLPNTEKNIVLSSKNIKNTKVILSSQITTYDILNAETLVIAEGSIETIEKNLLK